MAAIARTVIFMFNLKESYLFLKSGPIGNDQDKVHLFEMHALPLFPPEMPARFSPCAGLMAYFASICSKKCHKAFVSTP